VAFAMLIISGVGRLEDRFLRRGENNRRRRGGG
jgi:hypothetical protein